MKKKEKPNPKKSNNQQAENPNQFKLVLENGEFVTLATQKFKQRKPYVPVDTKKVLSFMPGTIRDIYVKKGDNVMPGDRLLILEAMKMKNEILAQIEGVVKEVYVESGALVPKNHLLVEFE